MSIIHKGSMLLIMLIISIVMGVTLYHDFKDAMAMPEPQQESYELQIGDTEYLLQMEYPPYDDYYYLLHVWLGDGRSIGIKPNGELEFEGELSEQAVEFWQVLAAGVPLFANEWCEENSK